MMVEYFTTYTLRTYSYYFPDTAYVGLNLTLENVQVPGRYNEYYITDPLNLEILDVKDIYWSQSQLYMFGHPPLGPMSFGELPSWALATELANWVKVYSNWNYTFEFHSPNIVRISPAPDSEAFATVWYERNHHPSLMTIPNDQQMLFSELALADIMILIGNIRSKYGDGNSISTPFGNIPLQGAYLLDMGQKKKDELTAQMLNGSLPSVMVDFG
jgi:hypothetical protein